MEIKWGNVFIALIVVVALINLPAITHNLASLMSSSASVLGSVFEAGNEGHNSQAYDLARICILFIFILGVLRLMRRRH